LLTDNSLDAVLQGLELAESLGLFPEAKYIKFKPGGELALVADRILIRFNLPEEATQFFDWLSGYIKPEEQISKEDIGRPFFRVGREKPEQFLIKLVTDYAIKRADYYFGRKPEVDSIEAYEQQADLDYLNEALDPEDDEILNNVMQFISTMEPSAWRHALSLVDTMGVTKNQAQQISDRIYNIIDEMFQDPDHRFNVSELRRLYAGEDIRKSGVVNRLHYEKDLERDIDAYIAKVMELERAVTDGLELLDYEKYGEEFGRYDVYNNSDLVKLMR
jgi:glycosyltransferase involved in cell wall biosynthesis